MPFINEVLTANQTHNELSKEAAMQTRLGSRFAFEPVHIKDFLSRHIIGQSAAIDALCQQLNLIKAGLHAPDRPLLVMLLVGDTGVGKTELVRLLAQAIHGDKRAFCRIDMNTLSQSHYSAAITGAPPGYVGSKENTTLIDEEKIKGSASRPGIVLFDEIEKASPDVARSLMNIFDRGALPLASGTRVLDFSNCLVFMTSNLGSRQYQASQKQVRKWWPFQAKSPSRREQVESALTQHFDPEFINRIDHIALFDPLTSAQIEAIIALEIESTNHLLAKRNIRIGLDQDALSWLQARGFDPRYGARSIKRNFSSLVLHPLAEALVACELETLQPGNIRHFRGRLLDQKIRFSM